MFLNPRACMTAAVYQRLLLCHLCCLFYGGIENSALRIRFPEWDKNWSCRLAAVPSHADGEVIAQTLATWKFLTSPKFYCTVKCHGTLATRGVMLACLKAKTKRREERKEPIEWTHNKIFEEKKNIENLHLYMNTWRRVQVSAEL